MSDHDGTNLFDFAGQLSRRQAIRAYAPPALASIGVLSIAGFSAGSGNFKHVNAGRGNGSEGEPDRDPGNSGLHNKANDGGDSPGRGPSIPRGPGKH
jgi:hypothetical protein